VFPPVPSTRGIPGLSPKQISNAPKLNFEAIRIGGVFIKILNVKPPWTNAKPPYWKLSVDGSGSPKKFCTKQMFVSVSRQLRNHADAQPWSVSSGKRTMCCKHDITYGMLQARENEISSVLVVLSKCALLTSRMH